MCLTVRIFTWVSLVGSVASLVAWPASFYRAAAISHFGSLRTDSIYITGGKLQWKALDGRDDIEVMGESWLVQGHWAYEFIADPVSYFGPDQYWHDTLRFSYSRSWTAGRTNRFDEFGVPLWCPVVVGGLLPAAAASRWIRCRDRTRQGLCQVCGYDLRAARDRCPECGTVRINQDIWRTVSSRNA